MKQQNEKVFLFKDENEFSKNLYDSIRDYYIQTTEVYEQHQQIYFAVLAVIVGALIFIGPTEEDWAHNAMLLIIAFLITFGSTYFRSAAFYTSQRFELAAKLDLFTLQWTMGCQPDGRTEPYLILDKMWKEFNKSENINRSRRPQDFIKNFLGDNSDFIRRSPREAIIAMINCSSVGLGLWYSIIFYPWLNIFNLNPILICLLPSFTYYFTHVYWSQHLVNEVFISYKKIYLTKIKLNNGCDGKKLVYLGGNE